jgi:hypothetical protein
MPLAITTSSAPPARGKTSGVTLEITGSSTARSAG